MKKVGLLLFSLSIAASSFAQWSPAKNWLIKDGKLQPGVTCYRGTNTAGTPDAVVDEKDGYVELTHTYTYSDCKLMIDQTVKPFTLKGKYLHIEYQLPEEIMLYEDVASDNLKLGYAFDKKEKPVLIVSAVPDTGSKVNFDNSLFFSRVNVDGKFNPEACKGFVTYEGCSFWKSDEKVGAVMLSLNREAAFFKEGYPVAKIKNLYYYEPENDDHPFFACAFDGSDTWTENINIVKSNGEVMVDDEGIFPYSMLPAVFNDDSAKYMCEVRMLYQNGSDNWTGGDGSGYLSTELFHGLLVKSMGNTTYNKKICGQANLKVGIADIPVPEKNSGKMKISCLVTLDSQNNPKLKESFETDYLPVFVKFDNSNDTIQVFKTSQIHPIYTAEKDEVVIPNGAKTVSVMFGMNPTYSYVVDELVLSTTYETSVANVNGEAKSLSIYPNPVYGEIAFSGVDDVKSVEIVAMNGSKIACSLVNGKINVSNLAAGEYVLIVNKTISGKFIKK